MTGTILAARDLAVNKANIVSVLIKFLKSQEDRR